MKRCKECGKALPRGNSIVSYAARKLGYCRYCYLGNYPENDYRDRSDYREGTGRPLTWDELILSERAAYNPEVWSPEFRAEMEEYWEARRRGEL